MCVCVCYSDTVSRSGVYCAVSNSIEQCKAEGVIDVFQAVKLLRMNKPGAVNSIVSSNDHYIVYVLIIQGCVIGAVQFST